MAGRRFASMHPGRIALAAVMSMAMFVGTGGAVAIMAPAAQAASASASSPSFPIEHLIGVGCNNAGCYLVFYLPDGVIIFEPI